MHTIQRAQRRGSEIPLCLSCDLLGVLGQKCVPTLFGKRKQQSPDSVKNPPVFGRSSSLPLPLLENHASRETGARWSVRSDVRSLGRPAFRIPPLRACAPPSHAYCSPYPPGCSLLCPSSLSLARLVDAKVVQVGDCGTCLALQEQVNLAAMKVLKEREPLRSIRGTRLCLPSLSLPCML